MPSWGKKSGDSLGDAEFLQVDCCAVTFAACGHVAGFYFLLLCLGFFILATINMSKQLDSALHITVLRETIQIMCD